MGMANREETTKWEFPTLTEELTNGKSRETHNFASDNNDAKEAQIHSIHTLSLLLYCKHIQIEEYMWRVF